MRRTRVRIGPRIAVVAALAAAVLGAGRAAGGADAGDIRPVGRSERHVVQAGETLWAIARAQVGPAADPRPLVEVIREANSIGPGGLRPGVVLRLPPAP